MKSKIPSLMLVVALSLFTWSGGVAFEDMRSEGISPEPASAIVIFALFAIIFGRLIWKRMQ